MQQFLMETLDTSFYTMGSNLMKVCRTEGSAKKYITEHKKSALNGTLPL
jgi:hypothetical protein